jgi:hypothetical protein
VDTVIAGLALVKKYADTGPTLLAEAVRAAANFRPKPG